MNFLGYRAEDFFKLQSIEYKPFGKGPWPCLNPASDHFKQAKIKECCVERNGNNSKPIGIFSCICGFVYSRTGPDSSPKDKFQATTVQSYGLVWDAVLTELWQDSTLKLSEIGQRLGVHYTTIKRQAARLNLIFPRPGGRSIQGALTPPRQRDSQIVAIETLESYRQEWLSVIKQNPELGNTTLAQRFRRIHSWLYRNDAKWLENHLPPTQLRVKPMPRVDWESRDVQLADAVRLSGLSLKNSPGKPVRVSVEEIGKKLGQRARITKQIDKLPLTAKALAEVAETIEDFTIRKIYWAAERFHKDGIHLKQWQFLRKAGLEGSRFLSVPKVQNAIDTAMEYLNSPDTLITTSTPPSEASILENLLEEKDVMLGCFPDSYPDELFYSICARFHDRVQYPSQRSTIRDLFQTKNAIAIFDLPSRLDKLIASLPAGHRYTVEYLIDNYTLLPFYRPFLPPDRLQLVTEDMRGDNGSKIHTRLGIVAGSIETPAYLRFCPICIQKDREQFGESYWHRLHQVTGVEVCPTHQVFLEQSTLQTHNRRRLYEFISAERITANLSPREIDLSNICHKFLLKIASEVEWLLNDCQSVPGLEFLYLNYRSLVMNNSELVTYAGRIRVQELLKNFKNYYPAEVLEILQCQVNEQSRDNWLCELVRFPRRVHNPLRHLLLINFLGFTAKEFFELKEAPKPFGDGPWPCLNPVCKNFTKSVISKCHITYNQENHRPTGNFACTCGFAYFRIGPDKSPEERFQFCRVKVYGIFWEKSLKTLWKDPSLTLKDLKNRLGVTVKTILRQAALLKLTFPRPNSRARATELCASLQPRFVGPRILSPEVLESYRNLWLEEIAHNPGVGRTQLRSQIPTVYAQLYNYDKGWLNEHLPPPQAKNGTSSVDWASRDTATMEAVKVVTQRLKENVNPIIWVTRTTIANSLNYPASAWIKKHLNNLPMTANVVEELSETREEFAVRKVQWAADCFRQENLCPQRWELVRRASLRPKTTELPLVKEAIATALEALGSLLLP
ncbi:TnsD family Tn7-like transposition protein [Nostoc sp. DedVER01b]|nr:MULTISPECIES: TnsD family Tn7-like transposition protein [unclassified Nostoc]MDZ7990561.1 TnsD family Tn7-like transposition protein [Nostoc sp. DedVER02]MDZ8115073.1 TnsD family Tn7-like transposition protein [Nostoc sp. DedVER01b]